MSTICERGIDAFDDAFNLISSCPLCIAGVPVGPSYVLLNLRCNRVEKKPVDGIDVIGEDELRPREDAELVAGLVEIVDAGFFVRWLINPSSPDSQLQNLSAKTFRER